MVDAKIVEPPHLLADLKTLCLTTMSTQFHLATLASIPPRQGRWGSVGGGAAPSRREEVVAPLERA